tara:strand:- start:266 stop:1369 length:1104 start_codon:yes stop_codon:yes gene_type:complete
MASTFTSRFKLEKMETGANANTWGTRTNNNLDVLDAFGGGYIAKSVAGSANITLSTADADPTAESSNKVIELTGALTGDIVVFVPATEGEYVFFNNTTGSQTLTIAATGHTANGIQIAQGAYSHIYNDGSSNFKMYNAVDKLGATTFKGAVTAGSSGQIILRDNGAVTATTFTGDGSNLTGIGGAIPSGTKMVFYQASAPTGWTKDTTAALNEAVMSIVTGSGAGTGGSTAYFSSFLATTNKTQPDATVTGSVAGTVGGHTLSTPEISSHTHGRNFIQSNPPQSLKSAPNQSYLSIAAQLEEGAYRGNPFSEAQSQGAVIEDVPTSSAGGGGSHSHPFSGSLSSATAAVTIPAADVKYANVIIAAKD